jgi:hypothetical protein
VYEVVAAEAVTGCDKAPPSDQLAKVYWVPAVGDCGEDVAMVCWLPTCQVTGTGEACGVPPSTLTANPDGEVLMMTPTLFATKFAVTISGPVMVTLVDALPALATGPVQFANL